MAGLHVWSKRHKKQNKVNKGRDSGQKTKLLKKRNRTEGRGSGEKKGRRKRRSKEEERGLRPPVSQSNLFPLHLRWLKRQSITSFYPFFVCFHFLVRLQHGVFQRFHPIWLIRPESAQICPSLSRVNASQRESWKKKKKHVARRGPMLGQRRPSRVAALDASTTHLAPRPCFPASK